MNQQGWFVLPNRSGRVDSWWRFSQAVGIDELFGNPPPFQPFDSQHGMTLLVGLGLLLWLIYLARRWPDGKLTKVHAWTMAVILLLVFPLNLWIYPKMGMQRPWPMHLCDWAAVTAAIALITRRRIFVELTFFWALAGATNALITPDAKEGFPHPRFVVFFIHHIGVVIVGLWATIGLKIFPQKGAVWRVFGWTQVFMVAAMLVNKLTGHNYGFLSYKPREAEGTLLDVLGPWPWYILSLQAVCLLLFLILNVPWVIYRKVKRRRE